MPKASRKENNDKQKTACDAMREFEENPTFATFYTMCDIVRKSEAWQCADSLREAGSKIPIPELKKILEFITTEGQDSKWNECEISVYVIIESHHYNKTWISMSDERLECLAPHLDHDFWNDLIEQGNLRDPQDIPHEKLRTVLDSILKP